MEIELNKHDGLILALPLGVGVVGAGSALLPGWPMAALAVLAGSAAAWILTARSRDRNARLSAELSRVRGEVQKLQAEK